MTIISFADWSSHAKKHEHLVSPLADAFVKRRQIGAKHPVHDFLFTYYNFSPAKLKNWFPSFEEKLEMPLEKQEEFPWLSDHWFCKEKNVLLLNKQLIQKSTLKAAHFIMNLCDNVSKQPPRFGCFGLHEWAMVYKASKDEIRHQEYPLRLPQKELDNFVKSQTICCSHYDAYRFFTEEAKPLNVLNPLLETRLQMEQSGCLHANMDLYKWATRLWPWIGSDFLAKTFFLALEGRELDMRASPYDLREDGFLPICIETEEGRAEYRQKQQQYTERAAPLREELSAFCRKLLQD